MNWLEQIGCYFLTAVVWLLGALVFVINQVIAALAGIAAAALALLPDFPETPGLPGSISEGVQAVNWIIPVGTYMAVLATCVTLWFIWLGVAAALRWVRAVE